jgi:hypothetical protein
MTNNINDELTLIEGMKKMKVIEKRIVSYTLKITEYSSKLSNEKPQFETEREQRDKIVSLTQSIEDLTKEYRELHNRVNLTNMVTKVTIGGREYTIHDLILIRRKLADLNIGAFNAMNTSAADRSIRSRSGDGITIERLYDEKFKNERLEFWQELKETIDGRLESVNATTKLLPLSIIGL